jgi:hypothetical protein
MASPQTNTQGFSTLKEVLAYFCPLIYDATTELEKYVHSFPSLAHTHDEVTRYPNLHATIEYLQKQELLRSRLRYGDRVSFALNSDQKSEHMRSLEVAVNDLDNMKNREILGLTKLPQVAGQEVRGRFRSHDDVNGYHGSRIAKVKVVLAGLKNIELEEWRECL